MASIPLVPFLRTLSLTSLNLRYPFTANTFNLVQQFVVVHYSRMGIETVDQVRNLFRPHGVTQIYVKRLAAKQDNDKNQIYLGKGLAGALNLFPATILTRSASKSTRKTRSHFGKPKVEARIDLAWLGRDGKLHSAPQARLIDYFQYPEIRLSGFLRGCDQPPDALRRSRQEEYGARILLLGASPCGQTLGLVITEREDGLVEDFPSLPALPAFPNLQVLACDGPVGATPAEALLGELGVVYRGGWHPSVILKPGADLPIPFRGNPGAGYTLEALLGIPANANRAPDKFGYEIKSYGSSRVSLMTPTADCGYEGSQPFRSFLERFGRRGKVGDGRVVFTGVHRSGSVNSQTGCRLEVFGYDAGADRFSPNPAEIIVAVVDDRRGDIVSGWTFPKLANAWNTKHASAIYVASQKRPHRNGGESDADYRYSKEVLVCEGTDVWRLLRAIHSGDVYYDPAHTIYADGRAKVRPQWRVSTSGLQGCLQHLYRDVRSVSVA